MLGYSSGMLQGSETGLRKPKVRKSKDRDFVDTCVKLAEKFE